MKKLIISLTLILPTLLFGQEIQLDTKSATVEFYFVEKDVKGTLDQVEAFIKFDPNDLSKSSIVGSVNVSTLDTGNKGMVDHLKSADFFDIDKYPKMSFKGNKIEEIGDNYKAYGFLTIRDVTTEVVFDLSYSEKAFEFVGNINSADFGVNVKKEHDLNVVEVKIRVPVK